MTWSELQDILRRAGQLESAPVAVPDGRVTAIGYDSRDLRPGAAFVALKGRHLDGSSFANEALARGAAAIVTDRPAPAGIDAPWFVVRDARKTLALLAAAFYNHPSDALRVVGITGTNGKTTTAFLVASIFEAAGIRCGILGTVSYRIGSEVREATRTTPEAPELQSLLREMADAGCGACAMEVSSHALALGRVEYTTFAAGVFTNLTRDHLDFHGDMDAYFQAKRHLFELLPASAPGLVNLDDPRGAAMAEATARPVTYAINQSADIAPGPFESSQDGLKFEVRTPRGTLHIRSALVGRPNVYNILAAVGTATALGLPFDAIERGVASLASVPGRFEMISRAADGITVVVDYAHTDDALKHLLETARRLTLGRVITVFGCGGDRDRSKRPLMGAVAGRLSDLIVITSDNPRSEDPARIIEDVERGLTPDTKRRGPGGSEGELRVLAIVDRQEAIETAIRLARPGDLVLLAGKGHEKVQIIGDRAVPFDDAAIGREALARRRTNSGVV
jgi:UDP-N-acetylmuramoyl-L-alanyl-D-glutamate--2,6-diaminopimelate ligase